MRLGLFFVALFSVCSSAFAEVNTYIDAALLADSDRVQVNIDSSGNQDNSQTASVYRIKKVYDQDVLELIAVIPAVTGRDRCAELNNVPRCAKTPKMKNVSPWQMARVYRSHHYEHLKLQYAMFLKQGWLLAAARKDLPIKDYDLTRTVVNGLPEHKIGATQGLTGGGIYILESDMEVLFAYAKERGKENISFNVLPGINKDVKPQIK